MIPLMIGSSGRAKKLYVDDVFFVNTRLGTGAVANITGGPDLLKYGGMVQIKERQPYARNHFTVDTARGVPHYLTTNNASAQDWAGAAPDGVTSFNSSGFSVGVSAAVAGFNSNDALNTYVDWLWRNAKEFFQVLQVTKLAGSNLVIDLSPYMTTVGMVKVKSLASGSWYIWHRSLPAGQLLIGETTAVATTLGHITVTGTTLTLVNGVIADGTYHVEAYAHDTSADGIIQCGSYAGNSATNTINLNFELQWLLVKKSSGSGGNWYLFDVMRGMTAGAVNNILIQNLPNEETTTSAIAPVATGFSVNSSSTFNLSGETYIYTAIRRPNKPPTTGTQVYNAFRRVGTAAAAKVTGVGFPPDFVLSNLSALECYGALFDRLRGGSNQLRTNQTAAESVQSASITSLDQDGYTVGIDNVTNSTNGSTSSPGYINHFFRRAPGVFDQICYGGTAANKTEVIPVLGVPAELWLVKGRSGSTQWVWGSRYLAATEKVVMPSPSGRVTDATAWNSTYPTATALSLGTAAAVNTASATYTAYFWATLAGVSKVGSFTKVAGTALNVDCGFTTGARFVMLFRVDAAGDFYLWDTVRGIVAANDPYLLLNSPIAEVTNTDWIDPYPAGFSLTESGLPAGQYIFLSYA